MKKETFETVPYQAVMAVQRMLCLLAFLTTDDIRGLPTSARNMQTRTTDGGMAIYSREDMQNVTNAVQAQNAPINEARRNLNAANSYLS